MSRDETFGWGQVSSVRSWLMVRLLALCALALVVACSEPAVTAPGVMDMADTAQLAATFNSVDTDAAQLILLLSPT